LKKCEVEMKDVEIKFQKIQALGIAVLTMIFYPIMMFLVIFIIYPNESLFEGAVVAKISFLFFMSIVFFGAIQECLRKIIITSTHIRLSLIGFRIKEFSIDSLADIEAIHKSGKKPDDIYAVTFSTVPFHKTTSQKTKKSSNKTQIRLALNSADLDKISKILGKTIKKENPYDLT